MIIFLIIFCILVLSLLCVGIMVAKIYRQPAQPLSMRQYVKLSVSGFLAFIADTVGMGSFAVNATLAKLMGTFCDEEMPAVNNGAQVIPGTISSLFFIQFIDVDITTLLVLVAGTCLGGLLGGFSVGRLGEQTIRFITLCTFSLMIVLLIVHQCYWLPFHGELVALHSWKLVIGFFALVVCGALTSVGIGLFMMVQGVLFLMNVSPAIAFPIMTVAGALQQPLTTLIFLQKDRIPLKKTLILSLSGCVGVLVTIPLFMRLTVTWLHLLLLCILIYNFLVVTRTYLRNRFDSMSAMRCISSTSLVATE